MAKQVLVLNKKQSLLCLIVYVYFMLSEIGSFAILYHCFLPAEKYFAKLYVHCLVLLHYNTHRYATINYIIVNTNHVRNFILYYVLPRVLHILDNLNCSPPKTSIMFLSSYSSSSEPKCLFFLPIFSTQLLAYKRTGK